MQVVPPAGLDRMALRKRDFARTGPLDQVGAALGREDPEGQPTLDQLPHERRRRGRTVWHVDDHRILAAKADSFESLPPQTLE